MEPTATLENPAVTRPGHGDMFTAHMITTEYTPEDGWGELRAEPLREFAMHPAMIGLHYGQVVFEGLKAHRGPDGSVGIFRPEQHARRFQRSAARLAMPPLPEQTFLDAVDTLVALDQEWLSDDPGVSLYLRPFMFGTDTNLMLRPSHGYTFAVIAFIAGGFFGDTVSAIDVWVSRHYRRAFPAGTGDVKIAGNYAPTFLAQQEAAEHGCQQALWLDAAEGRWIEEMGGMSVFFVRGGPDRAEVVTPQLTGTLLPSVTRDSVLRLAAESGHTPREERVSLEQWRAECHAGLMTEAFACGTAAVITPVRRVRDRDGDWTIGTGEPGPVSRALRRALVGVHHGGAHDPRGWMRTVVPPRAP